MAGSSLPIDAVQACYATWRESRGRDCEGFLGLMADEIEMRSVLDPALPDDLAANRKSLDEARQYFDVLSRDWEMIDYSQHRLVADGDTIVFIGRCHWRHRRTGQEIDSPKIDVWTFRDGKAVSFFEMFDSLGYARVAGIA